MGHAFGFEDDGEPQSAGGGGGAQAPEGLGRDDGRRAGRREEKRHPRRGPRPGARLGASDVAAPGRAAGPLKRLSTPLQTRWRRPGPARGETRGPQGSSGRGGPREERRARGRGRYSR